MRFFNSVKALYTAVGILFLLFVLGDYLDVQNEAMNSRHLQISIALERMIRLDQELTGMLALAVVEQNELRVTRYETVRQDVEAAIQKVIDLTKEQSMTQEISALREGHKKISDIEEIALQKMRAGSWKEGKDILFGDEYSSAKKTYEIDSETIPGVVLGEIDAIENRFNTIKSAALAARIGALCLLLWTGIMFSRRTRCRSGRAGAITDGDFSRKQIIGRASAGANRRAQAVASICRRGNVRCGCRGTVDFH